MEGLSCRPGAPLPLPASCLLAPTCLPVPDSRLSSAPRRRVRVGSRLPARLRWPCLPGRRRPPSAPRARRARAGPRPRGRTMVNTRKSSLRLLGSKSPGPGPGPGAGAEPGATGGSSHFISSRTRSSKTRAASCPGAKAGGSGGAGGALEEARVRARRPGPGPAGARRPWLPAGQGCAAVLRAAPALLCGERDRSPGERAGAGGSGASERRLPVSSPGLGAERSGSGSGGAGAEGRGPGAGREGRRGEAKVFRGVQASPRACQLPPPSNSCSLSNCLGVVQAGEDASGELQLAAGRECGEKSLWPL